MDVETNTLMQRTAATAKVVYAFAQMIRYVDAEMDCLLLPLLLQLLPLAVMDPPLDNLPLLVNLVAKMTSRESALQQDSVRAYILMPLTARTIKEESAIVEMMKFVDVRMCH